MMTRLERSVSALNGPKPGPAVAVLHSDPSAFRELMKGHDDWVVDSSPGTSWGSVDVVVIDTRLTHWRAALAQMRRRDPCLRLVALVSDLQSATRAVNVARADRVVHQERDIAATVEELRAAPLSDHERLEREVQTRTAVLQQVKSQWEQSFDAVQDPMAVVDADYRLIRVNRAYARHLGRSIVDIPGHQCHQLRAQSAHAYPTEKNGVCADCPVRQSQREHGPAQTTVEDRSGLRWVVSAYPVDIDEQPGSLVVHYRDVTREVERLSKMAKADKMSAVGKLAGAVAHELNSPMTSIMVFSEALQRKTEQGSELNEHAAEVHQSALRCRRLIQGLLRFARRPRAREPGSVSLAAVIDEIRPLLQHRIDVSRIALKLDLPAHVPPVCAHVADIEHLLVDLLSNAIEACSPGDTIALEAAVVGGVQVELKVSDTGRGMATETLEAAFDPFFTTKEGNQAAGLGLTTCEAMVVDMGGSIGLRSMAGQGTVAWVRLPVMAPEPTREDQRDGQD